MPASPQPLSLAAAAAVASWVLVAPGAGPAEPRVEGYPIDDPIVLARCASCHAADDDGRLGRISYLRKTPEGWQTSLRRMVALYDVPLSPDEARHVVRYLANRQGLAPEELEPVLFEVERRMVDHRYPDDVTRNTCVPCHSMGRAMTQRRTREEWDLLMATHRALYPLVDRQGFRRSGPPQPGPDGERPDARHPVDRAVEHLARAYPLETAEWAAWSATMRPPRLEGTWLLSGVEPGGGPVYGTVRVTAVQGTDDEFATETSLVRAETGDVARSSGQALVYTGYQWRGRSGAPGDDGELREVLTVSRDQREMSGRWFTGAYDELGPDVILRRVGDGPAVAGVYPRALERGRTATARVYGANLPPAVAPEAFDFGGGVRTVRVVEAGPDAVTLELEVAPDANLGVRDLFLPGAALPEAVVVHGGVDRIEVTPRAGMARVGGVAFPKQLQVFDAVGFSDGPDGTPDTADDLALGRVPVTWSLEEYAATFGDDDLSFVGAIGPDGTFTPAADGPNPERGGNRNNVGDVWVVATHARPGAEPLRARAHLLVTVPLYARFDPWREVVR